MSAPLIVGHAAANSPESLARMRPHCDVVEADVRLFHRRLWVRHAKSLGPLPLFWDEGRPLSPGSRFPRLERLLGDLDPTTPLMLDLKGLDPRMVRAILAATEQRRRDAPLFMCARWWPTADRLRDAPGVRVLHSVGSARQLRRLMRRRRQPEGVSIHQELVDRETCRALRARMSHLWTWPVDEPTRARQLIEWGVTGLISNAPHRLADLRGTGR
ncbi:MAG TPA: hypothetical protein PKE32_02240 [Miltoncostaeaceae bacterium]|nr:hypothetical protein [Miltoncostaeaceae bacterium]